MLTAQLNKISFIIGFPYRYTHPEFMNKYSFLHGNRVIQGQTTGGLLPIITVVWLEKQFTGQPAVLL